MNSCPPVQIPCSESLCMRLGDRVGIVSFQVTTFALCSCQHCGGAGQASFYLQIECLSQGRPGSPQDCLGQVGASIFPLMGTLPDLGFFCDPRTYSCERGNQVLQCFSGIQCLEQTRLEWVGCGRPQNPTCEDSRSSGTG